MEEYKGDVRNLRLPGNRGSRITGALFVALALIIASPIMIVWGTLRSVVLVPWFMFKMGKLIFDVNKVELPEGWKNDQPYDTNAS